VPRLGWAVRMRVEGVPWAEKWQRVTHALARTVASLVPEFAWSTRSAAACGASTSTPSRRHLRQTAPVFDRFRLTQHLSLAVDEVPGGNIQCRETRITRPGLRVRCLGERLLAKRVFGDTL
jgi:hypothetical protein